MVEKIKLLTYVEMGSINSNKTIEMFMKKILILKTKTQTNNHIFDPKPKPILLTVHE